jgi:predicted transcriptional regulator
MTNQIDKNYDVDAETALCNIIISNPDTVIELGDALTADIFTNDERRTLAQVCQNLAKELVDYARDNQTIIRSLSVNMGESEANETYAKYTADYVPSFNARHYLERCQQARQNRMLLDLAQKIANAGDNSPDMSTTIARIQNALTYVQKNTNTPVTPLTTEYLLTTKWPEPAWIVPDVLPAGLTFLAGKPKAGKSWMIMSLASAVGSGGKWLNYDIPRGKVLYLALEDSPRRLASRMRIQQWRTDSQVRFITPDQFSLVGALEKGGNHKILQLIAQHAYNLVVIDTITRAIDSDQLSVQDMKNTLAPLQKGALDHNCAVLVIDHMPKLTGSEHDVIQDVYGSVSKVGVADTIMGLYRDRGQKTGLFAGTGRDIQEFEIPVKLDGLTMTWQPTEATSRVSYSDNKHIVLEAVQTLKRANISHIAVETEQNKGSTQKTLKTLEYDGLVYGEKEGNQIIYATTTNGDQILQKWNDNAPAVAAMVG